MIARKTYTGELQSTTLGEVAIENKGIQTGPFGSQLHASDYVSQGVGVVMPQDLGENEIIQSGMARISSMTAAGLARHRLDLNDIVYSRRGDVTRRALVRNTDGDLICGTGCIRVRLDPEKVDSRYVSFALGLPAAREWITRHAVGATMANLNTKILSALPLELPELGGQRAIAEVLGAMDDKIAANRRVVELVDQIITSILKSALRNKARLWDAVEFVFGEAFKGAEFVEPGIGRPLIRIRDLKSQRCQVWTTETRRREQVVSPGDVLVGMDAEFRATRWRGPTGVLNQRVLLARSTAYGDALTRQILRAPLDQIERSKSGTTVIHLNKKDLEEQIAFVPDTSDVDRLRRLIDPLWERAVAAEQENVLLAATRDELLPLLMSGKITVKDAEQRIEQEV